MKNLVLAGLGSLALTGAASAALTGLAWETYLVVDGDTTYSVGRLYVTYDNSNDVLLNVFNANISLTGGSFVQNNFGAASFGPNAFLDGFPGNPAIDTWLTIGGTTSNLVAQANTTNFDPSFVGGANSIVGGWFNGNPPNLQGKANSVVNGSAATLIGQFVVLALGDSASAQSLSAAFGSTSNIFGGQTGFQTTLSGNFKFAAIPAPGALALLGVAGLAGARRRRA